jgi:hypothetical protein
MPTTKELAADAFEKQERVRVLEMMNMPIEYEDRKLAFIALSEAREAARIADLKLRDQVDRP